MSNKKSPENEDSIYMMEALLKALPSIKKTIEDLQKQVCEINTFLSTGMMHSSLGKESSGLSVHYQESTLQEKLILEKTDLEREISVLKSIYDLTVKKIDSLSPDDKQLINMRYRKGLSYEAIGVITYQSRETVRRRVNQILSRMKRL